MLRGVLATARANPLQAYYPLGTMLPPPVAPPLLAAPQPIAKLQAKAQPLAQIVRVMPAIS